VWWKLAPSQSNLIGLMHLNGEFPDQIMHGVVKE